MPLMKTISKRLRDLAMICSLFLTCCADSSKSRFSVKEVEGDTIPLAGNDDVLKTVEKNLGPEKVKIFANFFFPTEKISTPGFNELRSQLYLDHAAMIELMFARNAAALLINGSWQQEEIDNITAAIEFISNEYTKKGIDRLKYIPPGNEISHLPDLQTLRDDPAVLKRVTEALVRYIDENYRATLHLLESTIGVMRATSEDGSHTTNIINISRHAILGAIKDFKRIYKSIDTQLGSSSGTNFQFDAGFKGDPVQQITALITHIDVSIPNKTATLYEVEQTIFKESDSYHMNVIQGEALSPAFNFVSHENYGLQDYITTLEAIGGKVSALRVHKFGDVSVSQETAGPVSVSYSITRDGTTYECYGLRQLTDQWGPDRYVIYRTGSDVPIAGDDGFKYDRTVSLCTEGQTGQIAAADVLNAWKKVVWQ